MKSALIVIDCQNDFIKGKSLYSCQMMDEKFIKKIKSLVEICRKRKIPIVFTQHSIKPDKSNAETGEPEETRACIIGTDGWKFAEDLQPAKDDFVVRKDKFDAFYNTELESILKKMGIDTVILCGVLTNNCVRATAEGAYYRNFRLILISDCCGATSFLPDKTPEEIHDLVLRDLKERTYETKLLTLNEFKSGK